MQNYAKHALDVNTSFFFTSSQPTQNQMHPKATISLTHKHKHLVRILHLH